MSNKYWRSPSDTPYLIDDVPIGSVYKWFVRQPGGVIPDAVASDGWQLVPFKRHPEKFYRRGDLGELQYWSQVLMERRCKDGEEPAVLDIEQAERAEIEIMPPSPIDTSAAIKPRQERLAHKDEWEVPVSLVSEGMTVQWCAFDIYKGLAEWNADGWAKVGFNQEFAKLGYTPDEDSCVVYRGCTLMQREVSFTEVARRKEQDKAAVSQT